MALADLSNEELAVKLDEHGGNCAAMARQLEISPSTLADELGRRGLRRPNRSIGQGGPRLGPLPRISIEAIHEGMKPPNNCRVKVFLEKLDPESRLVLETSLEYDSQDLPAGTLRKILLDEGFRDVDVPGVDALTAHRRGAKPCRCKG